MYRRHLGISYISNHVFLQSCATTLTDSLGGSGWIIGVGWVIQSLLHGAAILGTLNCSTPVATPSLN